MKKNILITAAVFALTPVFLAGILYITMSIYYKGSFMSGTFINGIYATGMTVAQVDEKLMENSRIDTLFIIDKDGKETQLALSDIDYTYSYLEKLQELKRKQEPFLWINSIHQTKNYSVTPKGAYNEEKFTESLLQLSVIRRAIDSSNLKVEIKKGSDGYELVDTTDSYLDKEKTEKVIGDALKDGIYTVNLAEEGCYKDFDYTGQMKETLDLYKKLERFLSARITYKFDTADIELGRKQISDLMLLDEDGGFALDEAGGLCIDEEAVKAYIKELAEKFDTVNRERQFATTRGDTVTVPAGTYGDKLDQEKELEYLLTAVKAGRREEHEPIYSQRAWGRGDDDIGSTYIEVDLTNQMLYYYKNGRQVLSANVVTGNTSRGNGTPSKACYVYFKQKNRVLRGEDYATPVDYWMAVYGNIGIHDAKWRGRFGGSIYKTNGSHGCINTPYKEVSELYGQVEVGTPVMIFY